MKTSKKAVAATTAMAYLIIFIAVPVLGITADRKSRWSSAFDKAPATATSRRSPYEGNADAVLAGGKLFRRHCEECHGREGEGTETAPSLRSALIQAAAPGTLFWFLGNGDLRGGMPEWSGLPEQQRWQIVSYLKSLSPKEPVK